MYNPQPIYPRQEGQYNNTNNNNGGYQYHQQQPQQPIQVHGQNSMLRQAQGAPQVYPPAAGREHTYPSPPQGLQPPIGYQQQPPPPQQAAMPAPMEFYCNHGLKAAIRQVKNPASKVCGKWFACCPNPQGQQCEYKNWKVNILPGIPSASDQGEKKQYSPMGPRLEEVEKGLVSHQDAIGTLIHTQKALIALLMSDNKSADREFMHSALSAIFDGIEKPATEAASKMEI